MPPRKTNQGKQAKKGKQSKHQRYEEEEINDDDDDNESPKDNDNANDSGLRKADFKFNFDLDVPECYVEFFKPKQKKKQDLDQPKEQETSKKPKLTIKVENIKGNKLTSTVSWKSKESPFGNKSFSDLQSNLKTIFGTKCSYKDNTLILSGNLSKRLKEYFIDNFDFTDDQIVIIEPKVQVPNYFHIIISTKEGENYTKVKWDPKTWKDQTHQIFVDDFITKTTSKCGIEPQVVKQGKHEIVYLIEGVDVCDDLFKYFTQDWQMNPTQVEVDRKSRDKERFAEDEIPNIYSKDPLTEMISRFKDSEEKDNYCVKMAKTIQDSYEFEKKRMENYVIKANLTFEKNGSDKNGKNIWVTSFNVLKHISIDGVQSGRFVSEGDEVIVQYKDRKRTIQGRVVSINKGNVTALFRIPFGRVPPGCQHSENEKEEGDDDDGEENKEEQTNKPIQKDILFDYDESESDNENSEEEEEIVKDKKEEDNDDDEGSDYDVEEEEEEAPDDDANDTDKPYSITFNPNNTTYKRCALAVLHLDDMPSCPIKNIITNEHPEKDDNNNSTDVFINDASFDITNSEFISEEDRRNENFTKYLKIDATSAQTKCVEMALKHSISIVHGPPGCGKTSTMGLFAYHLLNNSKNEKRRLLFCAYSNQAVENIAKFVSPIVKALGKKMVWIPNKTMCFENKREFENATEEQKNLSFYKILTRETAEAQKYYRLQEKKWDLNLRLKNFLRAKKNKRPYHGKPVELFSASDQKKMEEIQYEIEKSLIFEADVVCCTLISSAKRNLAPFIFESVFIDEASQASQMVSLIPLIHHPSKLVLLGDHKQLDAMIPNEMMKNHKDTMKSLYLKLLKKNVKHVMLNTQFRMHPLIAEFPNHAFYNGKILNAPGIEERSIKNLQNILTPIVFYNVKGYEKKTFGITYKNIEEAKVVDLILNNLKVNKIPGREVGVITPYHSQAELIRSRIRRLRYDDVRVSSVDSFQGSERDYIILSLVRTNKEGKFGFLPDKHRINVSITRARKGLIIVGNFNAISKSNQNHKNPRNSFLVDLCDFYNDHNSVIHSTSIRKLDILVERPKKEIPKLVITNEEIKRTIFKPVEIKKIVKPDEKPKPIEIKKEKPIIEIIDDEEEDEDLGNLNIDTFGTNADTNNTNNANDDDQFIFDYSDDGYDDNDEYFAQKETNK